MMTPHSAISFHTIALVAALTLLPASLRAEDVKDVRGRNVHAGDISRIVSVGGAITETLYALGMDKNIVGIDTTSVYPPRAAAEKASVGYLRQLSAEGVLGLRPSLILGVEGAGPRETLDVLEAAHVPMVIAPDPFTGEGIIEKIRVMAAATGTEARGRCLIAQVRADLDELARVEKAIQAPKRVMFVLSFVDGRAMVSGRKTAADGIIKLAGAVNAIDGYDGYKTINDEGIIAAKPDVVLAIERGGAIVTADAIFAHPAFSATPAGTKRSFISMDGLYLLGFGPRTARAARDFAAALYPNLKAEHGVAEANNTVTDCAK